MHLLNHRRGSGLTFLVSALCAGSATGQSAELGLIEELRLGRIEGSGPDVFADIHDLAVDPEGRIYVVDVGGKEVRLFDRDGRLVKRLGAEGGGPGERRYLGIGSTRVTWDAHRDRLWIDDGLHRRRSFRGDTLRTITPRDVVEGPLWAELDVSPEGWFWMRRVPESDESSESSTWDLLDNCGAYRGFASVPHRVSLTSVGPGGRMHVVASGALDVEYILRLRLETDVVEQVC